MYNLSFLLLFLYITLKRVKCQGNNVKKGDIKVSKINNLYDCGDLIEIVVKIQHFLILLAVNNDYICSTFVLFCDL